MKFLAAIVFVCALAFASATPVGIIPATYGYATPTASFSIGVPVAYTYAAPAAIEYEAAPIAPVAVAAYPAAVGYLVKK